MPGSAFCFLKLELVVECGAAEETCVTAPGSHSELCQARSAARYIGPYVPTVFSEQQLQGMSWNQPCRFLQDTPYAQCAQSQQLLAVRPHNVCVLGKPLARISSFGVPALLGHWLSLVLDFVGVLAWVLGGHHRRFAVD